MVGAPRSRIRIRMKSRIPSFLDRWIGDDRRYGKQSDANQISASRVNRVSRENVPEV
jgi:hypothetical protein